MQLIVQYSNDTSLHIEGFGPDTILGAISDVLKDQYRHEDHPDVEIEALIVQIADELPVAPDADPGITGETRDAAPAG